VLGPCTRNPGPFSILHSFLKNCLLSLDQTAVAALPPPVLTICKTAHKYPQAVAPICGG
jgi:hypothetical protein